MYCYSMHMIGGIRCTFCSMHSYCYSMHMIGGKAMKNLADGA